MKIVFYGLTITSSWGNGHATTYRALCKALARRGHRVHFVEKDVEWYRSNRDLPNPSFCKVQLYDCLSNSPRTVLEPGRDADVVVIGSYFPDAPAITRSLLDIGAGPLLFYDIDTPITLDQLCMQGYTDYLEASMIPWYAAYLSFSGGPALALLEGRFGSPRAVPFYCSVDPDLYKPVSVDEAYSCDLSYLGTFSPDRQPKLMRLLNNPARILPHARFLVAGPLYPEDTTWSPNVRCISHVAPSDHPAFYSSSRFSLNVTRDKMVAAGHSPSVRLFEAAACGAAILSDRWPGIESILKPGEEILLPQDEYEVTKILCEMPQSEAARIGQNARARILDQHTANHRALQFEAIVDQILASRRKVTAIEQQKNLASDSPSPLAALLKT